MILSIKLMHDKNPLYFEIEEHRTISELKALIERTTGIPRENQRLISSGRHLIDHMTVKNAGIHEGFIHLVERLHVEHLHTSGLIDKLDTDEVKLLWTVNYLNLADYAFPASTIQIAAASESLEVAIQSLQKRMREASPGQMAYLALTAVRLSDLKETFQDDASKKFQPLTGGMKSYTSLDPIFSIQHLFIAKLTPEKKLKLTQNQHEGIRRSMIYQRKLEEFLTVTQQPIHDLNDPCFGAARELFDDEIDLTTSDVSPEELIALQNELEVCASQIGALQHLPLTVAPIPTLTNILLAYLNTIRTRLTPSTMKTQEITSYFSQYVALKAKELNRILQAHAGAAPADPVATIPAASIAPVAPVVQPERSAIASGATRAAPSQLPRFSVFNAGRPIAYEELRADFRAFIDQRAEESTRLIGIPISGGDLWMQMDPRSANNLVTEFEAQRGQQAHAGAAPGQLTRLSVFNAGRPIAYEELRADFRAFIDQRAEESTRLIGIPISGGDLWMQMDPRSANNLVAEFEAQRGQTQGSGFGY